MNDDSDLMVDWIFLKSAHCSHNLILGYCQSILRSSLVVLHQIIYVDQHQNYRNYRMLQTTTKGMDLFEVLPYQYQLPQKRVQSLHKYEPKSNKLWIKILFYEFKEVIGNNTAAGPFLIRRKRSSPARQMQRHHQNQQILYLLLHYMCFRTRCYYHLQQAELLLRPIYKKDRNFLKYLCQGYQVLLVNPLGKSH